MFEGSNSYFEYIKIYPFLLTELSLQYMRGPGQVHVPLGGPSTSGRSELDEELLSEPELQNDEATQLNLPSGLLYENNGHFLPLEGISITVHVREFIVGILIDNYIRPIYDENHKMVVIHEGTQRVLEITPEQAERFRINKPMPNQHNEANTTAGSSRPPRDRRGRRRNQQRHN